MAFRDADTATSCSLSGTGTELISNQFSWFYDLRGPSFTLGTACSSSLAVLHRGCQSIRTGESSVALVGGCNLSLSLTMFQVLSNPQFLADDARYKLFDTKWNGYSRGEGFAAIVLKPVSDVLRDVDPICAMIRGTGVHQDERNPRVLRYRVLMRRLF
ncbi:hypothetical protein N7G274_001570 [Stereocaulon virgatum]|uniref:Ketosynthase family 3 (KS3) domain-containing protein n=1 Tax=Stereocaulon virgatum TaxID=373712 RepID=A0ABR4AK15_9LECA